MKTLSLIDLARRNTLCVRVQAAREDLDAAIEAYNDTVQTAFASVHIAADVYNGLIAEAQEWAEDIAGQIENYFEDRSERWREGKRGQAYDAWMIAYQEISLEPADIETPDPLEWDGEDAASILEGLPEDPQ